MSAMRPGLPKARCAPWSGTAPRCCWPGAVDSATRWERSAPMPADRSRRAFRTTSPCYALATRRHSGWTPGVFWRRLRSLTCGLMRAGCCSALSVRPHRCKRTQTQDDGDLRCRGRGYGSGAARDLRRWRDPHLRCGTVGQRGRAGAPEGNAGRTSRARSSCARRMSVDRATDSNSQVRRSSWDAEYPKC